MIGRMKPIRRPSRKRSLDADERERGARADDRADQRDLRTDAQRGHERVVDREVAEGLRGTRSASSAVIGNVP